jgi:excisionase family DNA binding protein
MSLDERELPPLTPPFLTVQELADAMGLTRRHVYRLLEDPDVPLTSTQSGQKARHRIFLNRVADHWDEDTAVWVARAVHEARGD